MWCYNHNAFFSLHFFCLLIDRRLGNYLSKLYTFYLVFLGSKSNRIVFDYQRESDTSIVNLRFPLMSAGL